MRKKAITPAVLKQFANYLAENERSDATISKYLHDVRCFVRYAGGLPLSKQVVLAYKEKLAATYAVTSANSMLSALNALWRFMGRQELCVKQFKQQRRLYAPEEKELNRQEYQKLVVTARGNGDEQLALILQTICATGMRVSELQYITVEALKCRKAHVRCKGKERSVFLVKDLCRLLLMYAKRRGITSGPVFTARSGSPISRNRIWRAMKALCRTAGVPPKKVFPHNLRHLFARTYYHRSKDIARLADVLGHSSINTTRIYLASSGTEHKKHLESLQLLIGKQKTPPVPAWKAAT